ncbi:MAG: glycogen debranching N-terminal domain-containing protein [Pseudomonadota bacterium]
MAEEVIRIRDQFYILSTSARVDDRTRVLKHGDTFAVFDRFGDVEVLGRPELGIYHQDTRFLSRLALRIGGARPLLLSSTVKEDNSLLTVDLTNPDVQHDGEVEIPRGTVHVFRSALLWEATFYGRLQVHNYGRWAVDLAFALDFDADYADLFEVRGVERERRGERFPAQVDGGALVFRYRGLDRLERRTRVTFDPQPSRLQGSEAHFHCRIDPGADAVCRFAIRCETDSASGRAPARTYEQAAAKAIGALRSAEAAEPRIYTANEQFNDWLGRSIADLHMMRTDTPHGPYPYAGVPWFSTVFGRDGIITALECLWFNPDIAHGVLAYLAATQADAEVPEKDAQPGKILHETRGGEMAALGEVPFGRYYGSIDATPLFVVLAGAYHERTGDLEFVRSIWPHVERALDWIDRYGDVDGDGFVEYARRSPRGLLNQGWKDSQDSVFHEDGALAEGPIALCEVQGYVYAARRAAAALAAWLGDGARAEVLTLEAEALQRRFEETFWCEALSTYALALDGRKRPCRVRASNAGHCLFSGIAGAERAYRVAETLMAEPSFSGWAVRTVAADAARYNPMSYHNGSVWPHDNALVAAGLSRYGRKRDTARILAGLFDASLFFDLHRLPELFCGFHRRPGEGPTLYPVSCSPQTWASAAVLLLLQACLGLEVRGSRKEVLFCNPHLPEFLAELRLSGLRIGDATVDLNLVRHGEDVGINVARREGDVRVVAVK